MKKRLLVVASAILVFAMMATACGQTSAPAAKTDEFLSQLNATYTELFPELNKDEYYSYWEEAVIPFSGEENAETYIQMLQSACVGTIYGEDAIAAYPDMESAQFNCFFINGVDEITINNNNISGKLDGKEVFSHVYSYQEDKSMGGMMDVRVYKTADKDAGEFTYFLFCPDTPDSTYHIEFRYGSDLDELLKVVEGDYAYWLAAGIPVGSDAEFVKACIALFAEENLSEGE